MFFVHPMWSSESERIGMQKCTPVGYAIRLFADFIGLVGLLMLLICPAILIRRWFIGVPHASPLGLMAMPVVFGVVSEVVYQVSCLLASRRHFHYVYEADEASWIEAGERRTYRWSNSS